jgi:drug/metabolite transporter (DMT)-like permease
MLLAGLLHATWHALVKSGDDQITVLAGMGLVAVAMALVALVFVAPPPAAVWLVMLASAVLHIGYKLCLAWAYAHGDLGQAFPLARGMVPLFATGLALLTLGQVPSAGQAFGVGLVSFGLLLLALERTGRQINRRLLMAAAGAGATVAAYSVLDAYGTRVYGDWAGFTAWIVILDNLAFLPLSRLIRGPALWADLYRARGRVLVSGVLGMTSFSVFVWALSRSPVGLVSALRETSVLFAMAIGIAFFAETLSPRRVAAACAIVTGIVTISLSR